MQDIESKREFIIEKALKLEKQCDVFEFAIQSNLFVDKEISFLKKYYDIIVNKHWIVVDEHKVQEFFGSIPANLSKILKTIKKQFIKDIHFKLINSHTVALEYYTFKKFLTNLDNNITKDVHDLFQKSEVIIAIYNEYLLHYKLKEFEKYKEEVGKELKDCKDEIAQLKDLVDKLNAEINKTSPVNEQTSSLVSRILKWFIHLVR